MSLYISWLSDYSNAMSDYATTGHHSNTHTITVVCCFNANCVFVCVYTCTFDSLSDESPHKVSAVLTPVWSSECVHLHDSEGENRGVNYFNKRHTHTHTMQPQQHILRYGNCSDMGNHVKFDALLNPLKHLISSESARERGKKDKKKKNETDSEWGTKRDQNVGKKEEKHGESHRSRESMWGNKSVRNQRKQESERER